MPCCAFSFVHTSTDIEHTRYQKKKISTPPGVCRYVRHPRREAYVASEQFFLKHGGGTLGIINSPVCNYNHRKLYFITDLCPLRIIWYLVCFSFLSERCGRRRPRAERSALYVASELFFPEAWLETLGSIKSPVCNYNHENLWSIMELCPLRIILCTFPSWAKRLVYSYSYSHVRQIRSVPISRSTAVEIVRQPCPWLVLARWCRSRVPSM